MRSCEKFRAFKFFHSFWIEVIWNSKMADLVPQKKGTCTFFCESASFYCIFSILRLQLRILDYAIDEICHFFLVTPLLLLNLWAHLWWRSLPKHSQEIDFSLMRLKIFATMNITCNKFHSLFSQESKKQVFLRYFLKARHVYDQRKSSVKIIIVAGFFWLWFWLRLK